jgi:pimeloyl-ACP methyl ester carboxylesterase
VSAATSPFTDAPRRYRSPRDGIGLAVFEISSPEPSRMRGRPPLLLVHGATADHTTWRAVGPLFAATRPVHAMDRRGRGESGDAAGYSIELEYQDVATVVDGLRADHDVPAIDVVGHSYGGRCALG